MDQTASKRTLLAALAACMLGSHVQPATGEAAAQAKFEIREFRILGSHLLPVRDVERAVYPLLGAGRDIESVKKAADALEKAYKDAGYGTVFVDIPEQTVDDGIVRLKVTEGTLARVHVRGARYFSDRQIRAELPALVQGETPHLPSLQQELTTVNARTADRVVTPVLKAGFEPGTVDVDLAVKDTLPLHGFLEVDDRHTADTTPNRATAAVSYDNLWQRQDSVSLQYQTAPADTKSASVELASYLAHVGSAGGLASFSFVHTSSNVLALGTLGVLGKGSIYGIHWLQPLGNTEAVSSSFNLGADYKDVNTEVFPDSATGSPASAVSAPVHYLNWSASFSQAWRTPSRQLGVTVGVGFGIRDLVNTPSEFENARAGGAPNYFYVRLSGNAVQRLPADAAVLVRFSGQWSADPLVNNEQFSLGGADTVRGYLEAETLGDGGIAGTFELHSPPPGPRFGSLLGRIYAYGFVDGGVATLLDPLASQTYHLGLWSTGAGLRLENEYGFSGYVDWAVPEVSGIRTRARSPRVEFSAKYGF